MYKNIDPDKLGMPDVTDEIRLALHKKYAKPYIIYKKYKTYVDCYCTHCMMRYRLYLNREQITPDDVSEYETARTIAHDVKITCHNCGCNAVARAEKISRDRLTEYHELCYFFVEKNTVYAVCGELMCGYGYKQSVDEMAEIYGGSRWDKLYIMEYKPGNARLISRTWHNVFHEASKIYEPYMNTGGLFDRISYFTAENPEVLKDSFLKYVIPRKYISPDTAENISVKGYNGYKPLMFMAYATKYPAVEMLLKSGGEVIIREIIDNGKPHKSVIDLDGKTAAEVFKTDGNEAAIIRTAMKDGKVALNVLQCWRRIKAIARREKKKYKFEDAVELCSFYLPYHETLKFIQSTGFTPKKYINYIMRQAEAYHECPNLAEMTYRDYIKECEELHYDLRDTQISKPADLYKAHSRTSELLQAVREEQARILEEQARKDAREKLEKYRKYRKKLCKKYEYTDGKYTVIVPVGAEDIANEGKTLHHCVGGYAQQHIEGKTVILFMRDMRFPNSPLYTIEMNGDRLVQIRGNRNCDPIPEAKEFVSRWLEWVKLPATQKHPKSQKNKTNAA